MSSRASIAATRFGIGLSPGHQAPDGAAALLGELAGPDHAAARFPVAPLADRLAAAARHRALSDGQAMGMGDASAMLRAANRDLRALNLHEQGLCIARAAFGPQGFRERLALFWANHFATRATENRLAGLSIAHADGAIRPHLAGDFATLLRAAVLHPAMLHYLDQHRSAGPNSRAGRDRRMGLNENLGRELLELHTLGADGSYTQQDVREMALLLTGASLALPEGFVFDPDLAEPGPRSLLGRRYGGAQPDPGALLAALDDLAHHPDTARHVTRKLARHFLGPEPVPELESHLAAVFLQQRGALLPVYAALLEHPAAWAAERRAVRPPFDFIAAALRALDPPPEAVTALGPREIVAYVDGPLRLMGQPFHEPPGPAGFPDTPAHWISPPGLAARIQWAMAIPRVLAGQPDPRDFVATALGDLADPETVMAARAAETRWEGVGLVLAAPAFHRR